MSGILKRVVKEPSLVLRWMLYKFFKWLPDETYIKIEYFIRLKKRLNLDNPVTFNEKLQWLKLYDRNPIFTQLSDKYEVRKYIADTIGDEYLVPLLGVWNRFDDIDFNALPSQFVLKCTHDSGGVVICKDKASFDVNAARKIINSRQKQNFYYKSREWVYKDISPRIIAERYLEDESEKELRDYKIFCFDGTPRFIQVDYNRFTDHKRNIYDLDWNYIPFSLHYPTDPDRKIKKPEKLAIMLGLAKLLSEGFCHVRVDFYHTSSKALQREREVNGGNHIFFGEMTFYHGGGCERFKPEDYNKMMGDCIKLRR